MYFEDRTSAWILTGTELDVKTVLSFETSNHVFGYQGKNLLPCDEQLSPKR